MVQNRLWGRVSEEKKEAESGPAGHAPKSWPNWRIVLTDFVIVVLGVGVALAAQQAAEWVHWHSEVSAARIALRQEIAANNSGFFARRDAIAPCLDRQVAQAQAVLKGLETGVRPQKTVILRPASNSQISDSEWQSQRASQVLTHFPRAELAAMNRYYTSLPDVRTYLTTEGMAWQELSILQDPPAGMATSDLIRLRVNLSIAQRFGALILNGSRRQLNISRQLGLAEAKPEPLLVKYFCDSLTPEEYRVWLKRVEGR